MATVNSINLAKSLSNPQEKLPIGEYGGRVRVLKDSYLMSAILNNGDEINFEKLPEGAKIIDAAMMIDKDLGAGTTLELGYRAFTDAEGSSEAEDADSLISSFASTSAQKAEMGVEAGYGKHVGSGKAQIFASLGGVGS